MKTKNLLLGLALSTLTLQSCNVLDIDPTDTYSESTAYASIKNLDLYVKVSITCFIAMPISMWELIWPWTMV